MIHNLPAEDVFVFSGGVPSLYVLTSLKSKGTWGYFFSQSGFVVARIVSNAGSEQSWWSRTFPPVTACNVRKTLPKPYDNESYENFDIILNKIKV